MFRSIPNWPQAQQEPNKLKENAWFWAIDYIKKFADICAINKLNREHTGDFNDQSQLHVLQFLRPAPQNLIKRTLLSTSGLQQELLHKQTTWKQQLQLATPRNRTRAVGTARNLPSGSHQAGPLDKPGSFSLFLRQTSHLVAVQDWDSRKTGGRLGVGLAQCSVCHAVPLSEDYYEEHANWCAWLSLPVTDTANG